MFPMKTARAFSLVEMAMVLLALTLVLGSLLIPLAERTHQQRMVATRETLEEIKEALTGFAIINKRLPCPSDTSEGIKGGLENSGFCDKEGYLPWRILGVGRYDEWGRPFRYRVDDNYTTPVSSARSNKLRIRTIKLENDTSNENSWLTSKGVTTDTDTRVVAIIFSCGKNGLPDPTPPDPLGIEIDYEDIDGNQEYSYTNDKDRTRNTNATCENSATSWKQSDVYIYDSYRENVYDDVVTWLSKNTLMYRLIAAGQWPP